MKKIKKILLPTAASALVFGSYSCDKEDEMTKEENALDKLIGQWEMVDADGDIEFDFDYDYRINFEFHMDGDFEFCYIDTRYKYCYIGDWNWENTNFDEVEVDIGFVEFNLDFETIENDVITGEMSWREDGYDYSGDITLERVYVDKSALITSEDNKGQMLHIAE
ncbi:MAG: hypothetical protein JXR50_01655 [Prolixibacteraceae bacterium]|nr:hypothetical protein [Prolixibacteraceae bacterium]MBN2648427.1 hypothetical protein [Prolixibacteraceae bacterium]